MRKIIVGVTTVCVLLSGVLAVGAAAPANFAGTWALDKVKSESLPPQVASAVSMTLTVTQDAQQIKVDSKTDMGDNASMGGPGGGVGTPPGVGRGRGMGMFPQTASYKLDGTETTADNPSGRGGTTAPADVGGLRRDLGLLCRPLVVAALTPPKGLGWPTRMASPSPA